MANVFQSPDVIIGLERGLYSVTEGMMEFVEVCITVTGGQSLDHGYGSAVINISTATGSATGRIICISCGMFLTAQTMFYSLSVHTVTYL